MKAATWFGIASLTLGCGSSVTVHSNDEGGAATTATTGAGGTTTTSSASVGGSPAGMPVDCGEWLPLPEPSPSDVALEPIVPVWDKTGSSASNGAANNKDTRMRVGKGGPPNYLTSVGLITFELDTLPRGADVTSATLVVYQHEAEGAVYQPPMTALVVESVVAATIWDTQDVPPEPGLEPFVLSTTPVIDWLSVDVTSAVRRDLSLCRTTTQLRVRFSPENEPGSDTPTYIELVSISDPTVDYPGKPKWPHEYGPRLTITYATP